MGLSTLHSLIAKGDFRQVQSFLDSSAARSDGAVNEYDQAGYTPLMRAVTVRAASVDVARTLVEHGADINATVRSEYGADRSVMALALGAGDPAAVRLLLQHGADLHYRRDEGYYALIDAVHGRDVSLDNRLLDLLRILIASGVDLNGITRYGESGCRVLSGLGRFDAVQLLLDAGADDTPLKWTPLLRAVALGAIPEVDEEIGRAASLEDRDWWERTPWLLAIQTGDVGKARLLQERGANTEVRGRCGKPPLFYAIESHHLPMLRWLLDQGAAIEGPDDFGTTPLMAAAEDADAVETLLGAGARVNAAKEDGQTALSQARTAPVARVLLHAGASPRELPYEARRALLGFSPEPEKNLLDVSPAEFQAGRTRRFGRANPEKMTVPFWEGMIRAGITGYQAARLFEDETEQGNGPVWCAQRFGQSITFLPDGRIVQVAGEHEDHYDPDFCIYNDVFVHRPDGTIDLYGYPEAAFPPTDFHTATPIREFIYLIGSLGYAGSRKYGQTPVYRLDIHSFQIEEIVAGGVVPGWIYSHVAVALAPDQIQISGGKIVTWDGSDEVHTENARTFVLHTKEKVWTDDRAV